MAISNAEEQLESAWFALHSRVQEEKIKKAFAIFRENKIEPILIKGWAAASLYPNKSDRIFADIDLCIDPTLFQKAKDLAEQEDVKKLNVDLHCGFRRLDTVGWENLYENSLLVKIDEVEIRVLRPEDHLRVLCVHWLNDGGAEKERLKDIYFAVKNRPENFDWQRCLEIVGPKRRRWIVCCIGLAKKYMGLSLKDTPIEAESEDLPGWIIKTVEKEWQSDVRLMPLNTCLGDKKLLFRQIRKRIPPNAIQATIEMEGNFDGRPRIFYQIGNIFIRIAPSLKRVLPVLFRHSDYREK
jgi:hypothetical protein